MHPLCNQCTQLPQPWLFLGYARNILYILSELSGPEATHNFNWSLGSFFSPFVLPWIHSDPKLGSEEKMPSATGITQI